MLHFKDPAPHVGMPSATDVLWRVWLKQDPTVIAVRLAQTAYEAFKLAAPELGNPAFSEVRAARVRADG